MGKKYSILFDSFHLYHLPQFEPLIDLLADDERFRIYHSASREIQHDEYELCKSVLTKKPGEFIFADSEAERKEKIRNLNLDVFVCGWSRYDIEQYVSEKTLVCMAYHGIGIKPSYWRDNHERLDIRFVEGPFRMTQLRQNGIKTELALTGFMKLDNLFRKNKSNTDLIRKEFDLDKTKKTILFAPTFYPSSFELLGKKLGEYTKDYNLIIKPHMWTMYKSNFGGISHKKQRLLFYELSDEFDHVHLVSPEIYNISQFYSISDMLITDASSTIYEMMAFEKPVLVNRFYKLRLSHRLFKNRLYRARLNKEMEKDISDFCFEVKAPKDLPRVIKFAFNNLESKLPAIKTYKKEMFYKLDGRASERAKDKIIERLQ